MRDAMPEPLLVVKSWIEHSLRPFANRHALIATAGSPDAPGGVLGSQIGRGTVPVGPGPLLGGRQR